MSRNPQAYHILYDSHCGLCQAMRRLLQVFDAEAPLAFVAIDDERVLRRFPQVPPQRAHTQMHVIDPRGQVSGGYDAVVRLLGLVPAFSPVHALLQHPAISRRGRRAYGWVARNRYRLFGRA